MTRDLGDRTGPARPLQVTCTLKVPRWSASSLRHSPPDCAAELVLRTQPSRLGAQREGTRSSNHRGAATIPRRNHHTTKTKLQLETTSFHEATKTLNHHEDVHHKKASKHDLASRAPLYLRGSTLRSSPFLAPPPFELLREASRKGAFISQRLIP